MSLDGFFYTHPVFRLEEYIAWRGDNGTKNLSAIHSSLRYYLKEGRIASIRRGLYAVIPPNTTPNDALIDPYLIGAKVSQDSVLAYHTALELHGVAYSTFGKFTFKTNKKIKPFYFQDQLFQPSSIPTAIRSEKNISDTGVITMDRQGISIRVTDIEHTFVDALDRIELCGGLEEVARSLESIAVLNPESVVEYTTQLKSPVLAAKVGYFLEQRKDAFSVEKNSLNPLMQMKPKSPQYLDTHQKKECVTIKQWNLMVPKKIINHTFEEPNYDV